KPRPSDHRVGQKCIAVKSVECFPRMREMKEVAYLSHGITTAWRGRPIAVLANQEAEGGRMARAKRARRANGEGGVWERPDTGRIHASVVVGWTPKGNARRIKCRYSQGPKVRPRSVSASPWTHLGVGNISTSHERRARSLGWQS